MAAAALGLGTEDGERYGEVELGALRRITARAQVGLAAHAAIDLERDDDEPTAEPDWEVQAGPVATYGVGRIVLSAYAGLSSWKLRLQPQTYVGAIGSLGVASRSDASDAADRRAVRNRAGSAYSPGRAQLPMELDLIAALDRVSTATITTVLLKHGLRNVWMRGTRPIGPEQPRAIGRAFTLRFVPAREDLATPASWSSPRSTRAAIEAMPAGCVAVVDAMAVTDAGIFGDILCARMANRGVAGLVTDGVVRDLSGVLATGLPVWCQGTAAPPSVAGLTFVGWQEPIGCGGVAVLPDDVVVADRDGAVVIPAALLEHVVAAAPEQEQLESWIMQEIAAGAALPGLYPPNEATRARYEASRRGSR